MTAFILTALVHFSERIVRANDYPVDVSSPVPSRQSLRALDALTFFLADVQDGLGPYLAIYLVAYCHWEPAHVGVAMAAVVVGTLLAQLPAGAMIDRTRHKRLAVVTAAGVVAACCVIMISAPFFPVIIAAQACIGAAAAVMPPAIAGISLGLVGRARFARRTGRNEAFNHSGNVAAAILAGLAGTYVGYGAIFYLVAFIAVASAVSAMFIRENEIDHARAREAPVVTPEVTPVVESISTALLRNRKLMAFFGAVFLFHFGNAAMLPLVGQKVSAGKPDSAAALMSACIITAQIVMVPVALLSARAAQRWGRKPIFLISFLVLPIRGMLYTYSTDSVFLVAVQLLDGIGAGIYGVVGVLMVADLARGTGRFNLALGAMVVAAGLGAAASQLLSGVIAGAANYNTAFMSLSGVAVLGCVWFALFVRETNTQHIQGTLSTAAH